MHELGTGVDDPGVGVDAHPPELGPVVRVVVDQERGGRIGLEVAEPLEMGGRSSVGVDRRVERVAAGEAARHHVRAAVGGRGREPTDPRRSTRCRIVVASIAPL